MLPTCLERRVEDMMICDAGRCKKGGCGRSNDAVVVRESWTVLAMIHKKP